MKTWRQLSIWVVGDYLLSAAFCLGHSEACVAQKLDWKDLKDGMEDGLIFFRLWRVFWKALVLSEETSIGREKTQTVYLYAKEGSLRTRLYSHLKREQLERMFGKKRNSKEFFFPIFSLCLNYKGTQKGTHTLRQPWSNGLWLPLTLTAQFAIMDIIHKILFFFQAHQI